MARLLQIFGFLSVLFRGAILTFQSLTIGGIVFLVFILRGVHPESDAIRLPPENRTRNAMGRLWPVCIVLIGAILLNYREM